MDYSQGMVGGGFPMGAAAGLFLLFGLTVVTVVIYIQKAAGQKH